MKQSRRDFMQTLAATGGLLHLKPSARPITLPPIDRAELVNRHSPVLRQVDPSSPLSVGNGEFAFTADVTGLQTFPEVYEQEMPLCTMSQWGWHSAPPPVGSQKALPLVQFDTFGHQVGYVVSPGGQNELYNWLRENPHRLHLGRVALRLAKSGGGEARITDITEIEQKLDLCAGVLTSRFKFEGKPVTVRTAVHPGFDMVAVAIESPHREIVFESAEFMASFAHFDQKTRAYVLGPPVIPAQENHPPRETWNPTFELAYWSYGLKTASAWRERLGMKRNPKWDDVISKLSPLPVSNGVYLAHENCPQTYTERNTDHPSMLAALGVLPGDGVDREIMRRTLYKTMKEWKWDQTWGWDYPMTAMTAARLGETGIAIDALLLKSEKNRYLPNGHNWQRRNLPCYLPGNGGLLYAVAMMAAGWRGAPASHAPGFPSDGSWTIRWEKLNAELIREI